MKSEHRRAEDKLDKWVSEKTRSKGKCEWCGKTSPLNTAHIYSRKNRSTRWWKSNLLCLCVGCHFVAHQDPIGFAEFVKKKLGESEYEKLRTRASLTVKNSVSDLQNMLTAFKQGGF